VLIFVLVGYVRAFGVTNKARFAQRTAHNTALSTTKTSLAKDLGRKLNWKSAAARLSAKIYLNPATLKIANVTVSWEPEAAAKILKLQKIKGRNPNRPFMVGIVGIPGTGKSTSADILSSMLKGSIVMPMDGYHYSMAELMKFPNAVDSIYRRGAPDTFDPASLQKDLERIVKRKEATVSIPGFDHAKGDPEENQHTFVRNKHSIVICEGIYLNHDGDGWEDIKSYFDWTIYIEADVDKCINRLKERNKCIPGYTPEEIDIRCDAVDRVNALTVEKTRKFASQEVKSAAVSPGKAEDLCPLV
jgi:pantothenate kinase